MLANLDESLNNTYAWDAGAQPFLVAPQTPYTHPLLEPGFNPSYMYPAFRGATVFSAPALIPTAAVGVNPWDHVFGPINGQAGTPNVPALTNNPGPPNVSMA